MKQEFDFDLYLSFFYRRLCSVYEFFLKFNTLRFNKSKNSMRDF